MENGEDLEIDHEFISNFFCGSEGYGNPITNSIISLPAPGSDSLYYLFHQSTDNFINENFNGFTFRANLNYSLIDMSENDGLGKVVEKNITVVQDTMLIGQLTAVKHANNTDWWIISPRFKYRHYITLLLTEEGVEGPFIQEAGGDLPLFQQRNSGQGVFSPDGTKYVVFDNTTQVHYYDFDRSTGLVSGFQQFDAIPSDSIYFGGAAFSSDSRFLYISNTYHLFQFDTEAEDIPASKELIARFKEVDEILPSYFWLMQLGPDCRIYITSPNSVHNLHVIDKPNEKGQACEFYQRGLQLPKQHGISLPSFPHYRLGTDSPICNPDIAVPLVVSTRPVYYTAEAAYRFAPNPAVHFINLENFDGFERGAVWDLYDINGKLLQTESLQQGATSQRIDFNGLPTGIYVQSVSEGGAQVWRSRMVVTGR